jgi:hypothetical protein
MSDDDNKSVELKQYRFIGDHAESLDGGRPVAPGEYTGPIDPTQPHNAQMIEQGLLIEGSPPDPDQPLSGDELEARAKALKIPGRSTMTADELRSAVAAAERDKEEKTS